MINVSSEFREGLNTQEPFILSVRIALRNGKNLYLNGDDIIKDTFQIDDGVSGQGSFDVGAAVINQFKVGLNNFQDKFSSYDFNGARLFPKVGLRVSTGVEYVDKGVFTVSDATYSGGIITLSALDNMHKFEKIYNGDTMFPKSLNSLVLEACRRCGVPIGTVNFANDGYLISKRPEKLTWREVIAYCAQISGNFARINRKGALEITWYDFSVFELEDQLDGGNNIDYTTGDDADGGNFTNYNNTTYDGGSFESLDKLHYFYKNFSSDICTDDVVITGVKVTDSGEEPKTVLYGNEGYVISVEGNTLIEAGKANVVAKMIGDRIIGYRFRPVHLTTLGDPTIEAGDMANVSDAKMNVFGIAITNTTFKMGQQEISCDAETPSRNNADRYSQLGKTQVELRQLVEKEKSSRQQALEELNLKMENAEGMYSTTTKDSNGASIIHLHDKPLLKDSQTVLTINSEAIAISRDGGKTYLYGFQMNGDIIARLLSVVGINADWIKTGSVQGNNMIINLNRGTIKSKNSWSSVDIDTGNFKITDETTGLMTMNMDRSGANFYRDGSFIGYIGTNSWKNYPNKKGLGFYLNQGQYLSWSRLNGSTYQPSLTWTIDNTATGFKGFKFDDAVNLGWNTLSNAYISSSTVSGGELGVGGTGRFTVYNGSGLDFYRDLNMHGYSILSQSGHSKKSGFRELRKGEALEILKNTDILEYEYKENPKSKKVGFVIDDDGKSPYKTDPKIIVEGKYKDDSLLVGYLMSAVKELADRVEVLERGDKRWQCSIEEG